jgi:amino acid transporter
MKMENATFVLSASGTIFITGCVIIAHEISNEFRNSLSNLTGHHWVSVSLVAVILFFLFSILFLGSKRLAKILKADDLSLWSNALTVITLVMILSSFILYTSHYFGS